MFTRPKWLPLKSIATTARATPQLATMVNPHAYIWFKALLLYDHLCIRFVCCIVGEFYSVVKDDHTRASKVFDMNCNEKKYHPSCFNLAKLYCKLSKLFSVILFTGSCFDLLEILSQYLEEASWKTLTKPNHYLVSHHHRYIWNYDFRCFQYFNSNNRN
jgi:hypothetical protein